MVNKVDILTFDNSELQEEAEGGCTGFSFTLLEIIVSNVLCLGFLAGMVKLALCLRGRLLKRKEKLRLAAEQREQNLRQKLLSELAGANQGSQLMSASVGLASSAEQNRQADEHGMLAGPMKVATTHTLEKLDPRG